MFSRQTCNFPSMLRVLAWLWCSPESSKRVSVSWADGDVCKLCRRHPANTHSSHDQLGFSNIACVAAGCVTKSRYSPSAQRLPKACSDTPRMDTRICVFISDWLVCYAPCDWSYSCKICKIKYHRVYNVFFLYKAGQIFALYLIRGWKGYVWFVRVL